MSARERLPYLALALVTIAAGLTVHLAGHALPVRLRDLAGDALWAMMMVWWMGVLAPRAPLWGRAAAALTVCILVEASQAFSPAGLASVRRTALGHLVLGSDFDPRDLVAYAVGVCAAVLAERGGRRRGARPASR